jgi:hypothetical protein
MAGWKLGVKVERMINAHRSNMVRLSACHNLEPLWNSALIGSGRPIASFKLDGRHYAPRLPALREIASCISISHGSQWMTEHELVCSISRSDQSPLMLKSVLFKLYRFKQRPLFSGCEERLQPVVLWSWWRNGGVVNRDKQVISTFYRVWMQGINADTAAAVGNIVRFWPQVH